MLLEIVCVVGQITGANITEIDLDSDPWSKAIAIACVVGLTICNCFGKLQHFMNIIH